MSAYEHLSCSTTFWLNHFFTSRNRKSTLLNYLTRAGVMAENILFATLDPTTRKVKLPGLKTHPEVNMFIYCKNFELNSYRQVHLTVLFLHLY